MEMELPTDGIGEKTDISEASITTAMERPTDGTGEKTDIGEASITTNRRDVVPLPFVRKMRYHLDSCSGTNKSQYVMGGLGMIVCTGRLDCVHVLYMVVGHTKFGPDLVARSIAGKFNNEDTFNHAMLNRHIANYGSVCAYDDDVLETWRRASPLLFRPVEQIMSYRSFLIVADDGQLDLQEVNPKMTMDKYPTKGKYYLWNDVIKEAEKVSSRSLVKIIPKVLDGTYRGVGEGSVRGTAGGQSDVRLLPRTVTETRTVRIFVQRSE